MKNVLFLFVALHMVSSFAQESDYVVDFADEMPVFPGGEMAMTNFINDNIRYPIEAQAKGEEGVVYVQFVVRKNGELTDIKIMKGICDILDKEAEGVVDKMPNWTPGTQKGKKVNVRYTLPIHFKLAPGDQKNAKKELRKNKKKDRNPNVIDY